MNNLSSNEIREKFLKFFASKQHKVITSDSVVPKDDPTVLFTTAGMQQFKRQFLGNIDDFTRAATSQKCIRTDDLDEVGKTNFHHTFFEMLGNFSFGDYFKKEAIAWAWEFLTKELSIPENRLWVSVYYDDQEAYDIWKNTIGMPEHKIFKLGDKSNFWPSNAKQNGPNGPCGPCSEIFFDYQPDDPTVPKDPDDIKGRFAEIWNLVFTQFNRKDGGELEPLPNKNIDTGMGLERLCAVMQGVENNFQTDLFVPIIEAIEKNIDADLDVSEKRIIADHIRAATFAINDGVIPSNKERGSVVKSLINRSINLVLKNGGKEKACVYKLVAVIADVMKAQYPEILKNAENITGLIQKTEEAFIKVFSENIPKLKAEAADKKSYDSTIFAQKIGELLFVFHTTNGLPLETSLAIIEKEIGVMADEKKAALKIYNEKMNEHRERSREGSKMTGDVFVDMDLDLNVPKTKFLGYDTMTAEAKVLRIFNGQESVESASAGDEIRIVLDQTPFYAESGGQVGDTGTFNDNITITDTQKLDDIFLHSATVNSGTICVGATVSAKVDRKRRMAIMRNHTATHLLQAALRKVLGEHVQQQGSAVDDARLRFDFTHPQSLTAQQKQAVEDEVNRMIKADVKAEKAEMSMDEARKKGALAFFAEKYGQKVRVVHVPGCSTELCGGTHLDNTGEIGLFKIASESAIAQGIRRIEGVTAANAEAFLTVIKQREQETIKILRKKEEEKEQTKNIFNTLKDDLDKIIDNAETINGTRVVTQIYNNIDIAIMRSLSDIVKQKEKSAVVILGATSSDAASIIVAATDNLVKQGINAGDIVKESAPIMDGRGGGKPQFAQAGGKKVEKLADTIKMAKNIIEKKIKNM
jgi:alanyl-tRNA synthetase